MIKTAIPVTCLLLAVLVYPMGASAAPPSKEEIVRELPEGATLRHVETRIVNGEELTFAKFEDKEGKVKEQNFKGNRKITEAQLPKPQKKFISDDLQALLDKAAPGEKIKVEIGLLVDTLDHPGEPVEGTVRGGDEKETGPPEFKLNGKPATAEDVVSAAKTRVEANRSKAAAQREQAKARLESIKKTHNLGGLPGIMEALQGDDATATLELTKGQIIALAAQSRGDIRGIHPWREHEDTLASAMPSSLVSPWAINYAGRKGGGIGIYYTECGCADPGVFGNYTRLAGSNSDHSRNVGGIMRGVSPESYIYCRTAGWCVPVLPTATDRAGVGGNPPIHIINRSNGQDTGTTYTTMDSDWDNYAYDHAIAVFVSPGNSGGTLISPTKGLNTFSAGAYDDGNNTIASFSAFTDSEVDNNKPEFSAPGVNVTAGGFTMSGTSMSSPHAAAFAADLMSTYSVFRYRPYLLKAAMISSAWRSIAGGYDKVGSGGIDFYGAVYNFYYHWFEGGNGSFSWFDSNDPLPNNGSVDSRWVNIGAGTKMRITLSWLNRGTYTYDHRLDAHPIGMDLDISVYAPSGAWVAGSYSWDNSFETAEFTAPESGVYRVAISRYANRDTASKLHMGLIYEWR